MRVGLRVCRSRAHIDRAVHLQQLLEGHAIAITIITRSLSRPINHNRLERALLHPSNRRKLGDGHGSAALVLENTAVNLIDPARLTALAIAAQVVFTLFVQLWPARAASSSNLASINAPRPRRRGRRRRDLLWLLLN